MEFVMVLAVDHVGVTNGEDPELVEQSQKLEIHPKIIEPDPHTRQSQR